MKSFEGIKEVEIYLLKDSLLDYEKSFENKQKKGAYISELERSGYQATSIALSNVDLYTQLEIAERANLFMDVVEKSLNADGYNRYFFENEPMNYWSNIAGVTVLEDGKVIFEKKDSISDTNLKFFYEFRWIAPFFGFSIEDLLAISGKKYTHQIRDEFMKKINELYGTSVLMSDELIRIKNIPIYDRTIEESIEYLKTRGQEKGYINPPSKYIVSSILELEEELQHKKNK